jgi:hypothetical protein
LIASGGDFPNLFEDELANRHADVEDDDPNAHVEDFQLDWEPEVIGIL